MLVSALAVFAALLIEPATPLWLDVLLVFWLLSVAIAHARFEEQRDRAEITAYLKHPCRFTPYRRQMRRLMVRQHRHRDGRWISPAAVPSFTRFS